MKATGLAIVQTGLDAKANCLSTHPQRLAGAEGCARMVKMIVQLLQPAAVTQLRVEPSSYTKSGVARSSYR